MRGFIHDRQQQKHIIVAHFGMFSVNKKFPSCRLILIMFCISLIFLVNDAIAVSNTTKCVQWKRKYDGVVSDTMIADCVRGNGDPICCAAVSPRNETLEPRGVGFEAYTVLPASWRLGTVAPLACNTTRLYQPSSYESEHFRLAQELNTIEDSEEREEVLLKYLSSGHEIKRNYEWLKLVHILMRGQNLYSFGDREAEILSHFEIQEVCVRKDGSVLKSSWKEWIEPITVHGRHPFAFAQCRHLKSIVQAFPKRLSRSAFQKIQSDPEYDYRLTELPDIPAAVPIMNVDYILLQAAESMRRSHAVDGENLGAQNFKRKHFMMDAGSSTFDSSLFWFACSYSQVVVSLLLCFIIYYYLEIA